MEVQVRYIVVKTSTFFNWCQNKKSKNMVNCRYYHLPRTSWPIGFMSGIFTYIYHSFTYISHKKSTKSRQIYQSHGWFGWSFIPLTDTSEICRLQGSNFFRQTHFQLALRLGVPKKKHVTQHGRFAGSAIMEEPKKYWDVLLVLSNWIDYNPYISRLDKSLK